MSENRNIIAYNVFGFSLRVHFVSYNITFRFLHNIPAYCHDKRLSVHHLKHQAANLIYFIDKEATIASDY